MSFVKFFLVSFIFLLSISVSCNKTEQPDKDAVTATLSDYTGLDGCSWVIKLENGEVLEPTNLDGFNIDMEEGKKIWITYVLSQYQVSICMVGPKIDITEIWDR